MTSKVKVNTVETESGSTLTLGKSGDTVTLASGASQSGFGRTGTVNWDTTPKTASFTAVSGNGYFVNTTSGAITVTLPAGSPGAIVSIQDYNNTFDTNNLTIDPNGTEKINGGSAGGVIILNTEGEGLTLVYIDSTIGWRSIHQSTFADTGLNPSYITATGGTVLTNGDFKTHVFTAPGTFTVCSVGNPLGSDSVEYVVVAGGGGGAGDAGGGGGAGGMRLRTDCCSATPINAPSKLSVTATSFPITVGAGGSGAPSGNGVGPGGSGSNSVFSTITSAGGGFGGGFGPTPSPIAGNGGSGGGSMRDSTGAVGSGNTPPVSPPQGKDGGAAPAPFGPTGYSAGGGGAENIGGNALSPAPTSGKGGDGGYVPDTFFGPTAPSYGQSPTPLAPNGRYFSGGGSGGANAGSSTVTVAGGAGGGGQGSQNGNPNVAPGDSGDTNTGGGGGSGGNDGCAGAGGSGFVAIRYKFQ